MSNAAIVQTFVVVGPMCWGAADNLDQAIKNAKANIPWTCVGRDRRQLDFTVIAIPAPRNRVEVYEGPGLEVRWPAEVTAVKWTQTVKVHPRR